MSWCYGILTPPTPTATRGRQTIMDHKAFPLHLLLLLFCAFVEVCRRMEQSQKSSLSCCFTINWGSLSPDTSSSCFGLPSMASAQQ